MTFRTTVYAAAALAAFGGAALAQAPVDGGYALQPAATEIAEDVHFFHNWVMMPVMVGISLLVLGLLGWVVFRYNAKANPEAKKFSHNTMVEIVWTAGPILILLYIALFSFDLLFKEDVVPDADMTVKVTGYQWGWTYSYPDHGDFEFVSNMLPEDDVVERHGDAKLYRLDVDNRMVVPAGATVRVITTSTDVIHSFAMPSFALKIDAVPGRLNETWFRTDKQDVYYGQCSEICGIKHAFMPIAIEVVERSEFEGWIDEQRALAGLDAMYAEDTKLAAADAPQAAN